MAPGRDPRVAKAFTAMRSIGIAPDTVRPVLKRLLKLYEKNWELIEDDNYRTLADAIFEYDNDKMGENNQEMMNDVLEPPSKKLYGGPLEDQASSTMDNSSRQVELDRNEMQKSASGEKLSESSQSFAGNPRGEPSSLSHQATIKDRGKSSISMCSASTGEKLVTGKERNVTCIDQELDKTGFLHKKKEKILEHDDGGNVIKPDREQLSTYFLHSTFPASNICQDKCNQPDGMTCNYGASLEYTFDIASSTCGRVKMSLKCNHALGEPSFQNPNLDQFLKYTEDKYLRTYKIIGPKFSLIELFKEFCDSFLELGSAVDKSPGDYSYNIMVCKKEPSRAVNLRKDTNKKVTSYSAPTSLPNHMVTQWQPTNRDKRRAFYKIHDITNGTEKVTISLLDEIGKEQLPYFVYTPHNIVYQCAYVHVSLARIVDEDCCTNCTGDCLSSSVPCACARDTGGEFAYTPEGLLREEFLRACISMNEEPQKHYHYYCPDCPLERAKNVFRPEKCKGHLIRKFIKECWRKCRCNMQCGNRVVQRGITRKLQVFLTNEGKGWGLQTLEELPKGAFVCEYVGEILTNMELHERNKQSTGLDRHTYPVLLDADWGSEGVLKDEEALCLDATHYGNIARFINHRCFDANLLEIPVEVETPDHHYYHLAFFTKRKVEAFEELTWDYRIDFNDHCHPIEAFQCCCGSSYCRDMKGTERKQMPHS